MIYQPSLYTEAETPDIVDSGDGGTYIGWLSRGSEYDRSLPPEAPFRIGIGGSRRA